MRKHYVTFYSPGTFFAETRAVPIDAWDPVKAVAMSNGVEERYGAKPYAFQFSTYLEPDTVPDGERGLAEVRPKLIEEGPLHYIGGQVDTYDDICHRENPDDMILLSNMRGNGFWVTVTNRRSYRTTRPFEPTDLIVDPDTGEVIARGDAEHLVAYRIVMDQRRETWLNSRGSSDFPTE
jgi:hypothetical protein